MKSKLLFSLSLFFSPCLFSMEGSVAVEKTKETKSVGSASMVWKKVATGVLPTFLGGTTHLEYLIARDADDSLIPTFEANSRDITNTYQRALEEAFKCDLTDGDQAAKIKKVLQIGEKIQKINSAFGMDKLTATAQLPVVEKAWQEYIIGRALAVHTTDATELAELQSSNAAQLEAKTKAAAEAKAAQIAAIEVRRQAMLKELEEAEKKAEEDRVAAVDSVTQEITEAERVRKELMDTHTATHKAQLSLLAGIGRRLHQVVHGEGATDDRFAGSKYKDISKFETYLAQLKAEQEASVSIAAVVIEEDEEKTGD